MPAKKAKYRAFVSYSQEGDPQRDRVTLFVEHLRSKGIDAHFDRHVNGSPPRGWPHWMEEQIALADYVFVICTETYLRRYNQKEKPKKGKGAIWEGAIIRQELYDSSGKNAKFVPILFDSKDVDFIPQPLRPHTHYLIPQRQEDLLRWLTNQPGYVPQPLGNIPDLPPVPSPSGAKPAPVDAAIKNGAKKSLKASAKSKSTQAKAPRTQQTPSESALSHAVNKVRTTDGVFRAQNPSRQYLESLLSPWQINRWERNGVDVDALVELTHLASNAGDQEGTGCLFSLQIKESDFLLAAPPTISISTHSLRYWLNHSLPVLLVSVHPPSKTAYMLWIDEALQTDLQRQNPAFWAQSTVTVSLRPEPLSISDKATIETTVRRFRRKELVISPERFFELRERVLNAAKELETIGHQSGVESVRLLVTQVRESLRASAYTVTIAGPQRVGKSTLINALMGVDMSPVADYPTTAVPLLIGSGAKAEARVVLADGTMKTVEASAEALRPYVAQQENQEHAQSVKAVWVTMPNDTLARGISLVDTPGLHDASVLVRDVTAEALKQADAVLYVLDAALGSKFKLGQAEIEDLKHLQSSKERVIVVLNQSDALSEEARKTLLAYVESQFLRYGLWNGLPIPPLFVSGKDAWNARSVGKPPPEEFAKLEDELWGHLLRHRATGFHRLIAAVERLREAQEHASAMLSERAENGEEAGNLERARKACEAARRRAAKSRNDWTGSIKNEMADFLRDRVNGRIDWLSQTLNAIPADNDLPGKDTISQWLRSAISEDYNAVLAVVRARIASLASAHDEILRNALTESRAELGIPLATSSMPISMPDIAAVDSFLPEAHFGALAGLLGFFAHPVVGAITTVLGLFYGTLIGATRRRKRAYEKYMEGYEEGLREAHGQIIKSTNEWYTPTVESIRLQLEGRLDTFIQDAERRIKRLGTPLKTGEADLIRSTGEQLAGHRRSLDEMAIELARVVQT